MRLPELHADQNLIDDLQSIDELWNPTPNPLQNDPVGWVHEQGQETWSKQRQILQSVRDHRYTAVKSCHGPGKSYTAAWVTAWWLATRPDPFVVTSAPTSHQVRTILWREIRRAKKKAHLPGNIAGGQVPEWKIQDELIAFGRKPADYLDPTEAAAAFQGIHALNVLVILDEGSGIPQWLADACENLITNEQSRLLIIGNPDNPISYFANAFKPASGFNKITITAWDTPTYTGEPVSEDLQNRLTSKIWVEERQKRWGTKSPLYISKVTAEFPDVTDDTVFTPNILQKCIQADRTNHAVNTPGRYGLDVARLGADETVLYHNQNGYIRMVARWSKQDTMATVGNFRRYTNNEPDKTPPAVIDIVGLGAGVYDRLKELDYQVVPFNGGEKAYNPLKFKNRRSEAYWQARTLMDEGLIDIEEPDEDLQAELLDTHFKTDSAGRIQIEPKEDIQARLGHSPDRADAFVQSMQNQASLLTFKTANQPPPRDPTRPPDPTQNQPHEPADLVSDLEDMRF